MTQFEYDKLGNVTGTVDANGNRTEYRYDALNRRIEVKDANNGVTKTAYDKVGNLITLTDALNHTTSFTYDALNRQTVITDALNHSTTIAYDAVGNILATTDALNHTTSFSYDNLNRRIATIDALGQTQSITYDKIGNVLTATDELGHVTSYGYDSLDRQTSITDPLGHISSTSYDTEGNILSTTDELNHTTTYSYDLNHRLVKSTDALNQQWSISYDKVGNIGSFTDELGRTTTYTYDALYRRTAITDALGHATTYTYDAVGNRTQFADALNQTTKYVYDSLNRQIKVIDAKNQITTTGYDAVGNLLSITDSVGNITRYTYDAVDQRLTDTNSLGKTRSYGYDAVGDLVSEIDRNGRQRTYDYDALNRETAEHWLDSAGTDIRTFSYGYDAVGHLLTTNDPDSKYTYTYDLVDRITSVDNLGTSGVPNVLMNYSYDAAGNLLSVTDKINGTQAGTNAYTYDILNRVTRLTQSGTGVQGKRVDMSYDSASQMTSLKRYGDLAGTLAVADTSYTYDLAGRLTDLKHQRGATTLASYGLMYDAANRITRSSGTDGIQDYTYDVTNQLTGADHTTIADEAYSYDANGNRTNAGYGTGTNNQLLTDGTYNYTYDSEGNRTKRTEIATGKITEYVWDYRNRLTSVLFKDSLGTVTKTIEYTYDVNDRRIGKKVDGAVAERYVYDGSDIALVFDGAGSQTHRYLHGTGVDTVLADERGGAVVWALADNQGTVRDVVDGNGVVLNHVSYDSFGKVVSQSNPSVEFRFGYTGREQDSETGLDYYRARYYDASNGRFISEDPLGFGAGDGNLTRYVGNSPTNFTDPSGKVAVIPIVVGVVLSYAAGQALAPNPAQAPTNPNDIDCTDNSFNQAVIEAATGQVIGIGAPLIRQGINYAGPRLGNVLGRGLDRLNPPGLIPVPVGGGLDRLGPQIPSPLRGLGTGISPSGAAGLGTGGSGLPPYVMQSNTGGVGASGGNYPPIPSHEDLIRASLEPDKGGLLTQGGRAFQKHGNRPEGAFPVPKGNEQALNTQAQTIIEEILANPQNVVSNRNTARFGDVVEIRDPSGKGLRFSADGTKLIGFLEP